MFRKIFLILFLSFSVFSQSLDNLDYKDSVFEIVILKSEENRLKYEKELPLNLIPYSLRIDKYTPLGTAFRISENKFLSAAHVINIVGTSSIKDYFIRDKDRNVFKINNIYKYCNRKDYIMFDVENIYQGKYLKFNDSYNLNEKVFSVGNALGEGIILRDGLLTSFTDEMEEGEWKWLRFSAAASPGNSGGPLLNSKGEVIGIITMKSMNENLNYALPIGEFLKDDDNSAKVFLKLKYTIPIYFNYYKQGDFIKNVKLPKNIDKLNREIYTAYDLWTENIVDQITQEWKDKSFPYAKGSDDIIYSIFSTVFPNVIAEAEDKSWQLFRPQNLKEANIDDTGKFVSGTLGRMTLAYYKFSSKIDYERFFSNSKYMLESILKGFYLYRNIGNEQIRILSMGKADNFGIWKDRYQRSWLVADYLFDFMDSKLLVFALPTPDGALLFLEADTTDNIMTGYYRDLKIITNYTYLSYTGNFLDWQRFIELKKLIPPQLKDIKIVALPSLTGFNLQYDSVTINHSDSIFKWSDNSILTILPGYEYDYSDLKWKIRGATLSAGDTSASYINVSKYSKPKESQSTNILNFFDKLAKKEYPFTGKLNSTGNVNEILNPILGVDNNIVYLLDILSQNPDDKDKLESELIKFRKSIKISDFRMDEKIK